MKIHEYQAKVLFSHHQIPVPQGFVASTVDEAVQAAEQLPSYPVVVKAQVHAGGRGKGGGVLLANDEGEARDAANRILGMTLITKQTGKVGKKVRIILVEQGVDIKNELYLSLVPDRATASIMIIASRSGGMNIEEVAANDPEKIIRVSINPLTGIRSFHVRQLIFGLELTGTSAKEFSQLLQNLYTLFIENDCTLVEINPLIITGDDHLVALDAKIEIDSSALYRHDKLASWRDESEEDPLELQAAAAGLNYINLDGNIGNMVNGAGLAMATMDLIKSAGAEPANFLDVGGGASAEMVEEGFRIILSDPKVKGILINIFGGILRCDVLAEGVVQAATKMAVTVPVVVRMEGTNVEQGRAILKESGLNLVTAVDLADAAKKIAEIAAA